MSCWCVHSETDAHRDEYYSDMHLRQILLELFSAGEPSLTSCLRCSSLLAPSSAGNDTTGFTCEWFLALMATYPAIQVQHSSLRDLL